MPFTIIAAACKFGPDSKLGLQGTATLPEFPLFRNCTSRGARRRKAATLMWNGYMALIA